MNQVVKYKSGVWFSLILTMCVGMSLWLSGYVPDDVFDNVVIPIMTTCTTTVAFVGAWLIFRHSNGLRIRKVWGWTLVVWGTADGIYLLGWLIAPTTFMNMGAYRLTTHELLLGNLMGWILLLYPTETLRPRWLNLRRSLWQLLPMCALVALDYVVPLDLTPVISLYPFVLLGLLVTYVRSYRIWCEENFSTLDDIDVEWIMRYMVMMILVGVVYLYICIGHSHTRGLTQLWLTIFMLAYSTEKILFRPDPWEMMRRMEEESVLVDEIAENGSNCREGNAELKRKLEQWMELEKPYTNPDFRLLDLQRVLPMNRTYLSQFIHKEYGCTFYQFVNRYRIEEAQRLKKEKPNIKISEVSVRCGFSSPTVFTRTFTAIVGVTPREWAKKIHPA